MEAKIKERAERVNPRGVFFLSEDTHAAVQAKKARIQRNEAALNLKRMYIYVVVQAHRLDRDNPPFARLREWFAEGFAVPDMNLCALLYESLEPYESDPMDYAARVKETRAFLSALTELSAPFERTFLLSDRNERDTVHPSHWPFIYETLARLPSVYMTDSRLYESLEAKEIAEGKPLYLSAGIKYPDAEKKPPFMATVLPAVPSKSIVNRMLSIAYKPIGIFRLRGFTLKEAERALFGDRAEGFFIENYLCGVFEEEQPDTQKDTSPLRVWRVSSVIKKIAGSYAERYQRLYRQTSADIQRPNGELTRHAPNQARAAEPPPCAISLLRWDGLAEETHRFNESGPCVLRIVGGFPVDDVMGYYITACM